MPDVRPSLEEVRAALIGSAAAPARGTMIPVYTKVPADLLTPVMAYLRLSNGAQLGQESFLLESVNTGERVGRYSFLGTRPFEILRTGPGLTHEGDPLRHLERAMAPYEYVSLPELRMFTGGAVGYIAFDCIEHFEPKTKRVLRDPFGIPECVMMLCDTAVIFDHVFQSVYCIAHVHAPHGTSADAVETLYTRAVDKVHELITTIMQEHTPLPEQAPIQNSEAPVSNVGKQGYESFVTSLRKNILQGDTFQVVPSQRLARRTALHPFNCYRHLRRINPSPYMFYIDCGSAQLVGASPETLCCVQKGKVAVHAIAGTVRRGRTPEEDAALSQQLVSSEKDKAEHIMLVDLARNDISRVCDPLTTTVESLMNVEKFSHVIHLTSRVTGQLRANRSKYDALRSIFPAGTLSGAPKIRAIELIRELEQERRGVYGGAVGRIDFAHDELDVCIAIRTMVFKDGTAYLQAGGGIVFDSVEEDEYIETMNKLGSNLRCLDEAEAYRVAT
ncbi:anthranilate synthase [Malassezia obtusa]|uniref:anthranilate synthase n=1 Tax=Malassezia obtusa TaxID=76774 RepID=A0AAF0E2C3_9BASI|nr:anthranilate synthase [Malassezia obtusa]